MPQQFKVDFQFVIPTEAVLLSAQTMLQSPHQEYRDIAKVVIELTTLQRFIQTEMINDGNVDLSPWFDYWFGDTLETAESVKSSTDQEACLVAAILLDQEEAIIHSKESFLNEMKRLNIRPTTSE